MKSCSTCREPKDLTEFAKNSSAADGLYHRCRRCASKRWKEYYAANSDDIKEHQNNYYHANSEKNKKCSTRALRKTRYGVTQEMYDAMHTAQLGVCAICLRDDGARSLSVDHCHKTGKVRGLLCGKCNLTLGTFDEDIARFQACADYLSSHQ